METKSKRSYEKHLVHCPNCGKDVLDHMTQCPFCKGPLKPSGYDPKDAESLKKIKRVLTILLSVIAVIVFILLVINK